MKNIDRLTKHVAKNGAENMLIHSVPETGNWVVAEKTETSNWLLSLINPMGNITYNLGLVSQEEHLDLWQEITRMEVESKGNQRIQAKELKQKLYKFIAKNNNEFKMFIKVHGRNKLLIN